MLGHIAIEKKVDTCKTAQICVGLRIRELITLSEGSYTRHYIFYSVEYFFLVHTFVSGGLHEFVVEALVHFVDHLADALLFALRTDEQHIARIGHDEVFQTGHHHELAIGSHEDVAR